MEASRHRELIVGGHDIEKGRYPYYVSIDKNNGVIVSGVLIAPDIVLSAGHIALDHMDNLTLRVGPYKARGSGENGTTDEVQYTKWVLPTSWAQTGNGLMHNDYIIFQLTQVTTQEPVKLNWDPTVPQDDQTVVAMGLGWLNESFQSPASVVQEVELLVSNTQKCNETLDPGRNSYQGIIDDSMMCTVAPNHTVRDGCAWDSGGPIIIAGDGPAEDVLVALISSGVGCADPVFPSVQARIGCDFGLHWIRQQVCQLSLDPPADFHCGKLKPVPAVEMSFVPTAMLSSGGFAEHISLTSPMFVLAGCLIAVLVAFVKAKQNAKAIYSPLSHQEHSPPTYGSIDC